MRLWFNLLNEQEEEERQKKDKRKRTKLEYFIMTYKNAIADNARKE